MKAGAGAGDGDGDERLVLGFKTGKEKGSVDVLIML